MSKLSTTFLSRQEMKHLFFTTKFVCLKKFDKIKCNFARLINSIDIID